MKISVIIPTYNGAKKILNVLQALEKQTFQDFEIIVVVDGSSDNTVDILKEVHFENFRVIEQANGGRSKSRNTGAKEANGALLIFFDDDTRPLPDSIERHFKHHQTFPSTLLSGSVPEERVKMKTDFQKFKADLSQQWVADFKQTTLLQKDNLFLTAANFSIPAQLFKELHAFDENLTDAEDFDLAVRAFQKKFPVYFDPHNIAWHDDWLTAKTYVKRLIEYKKAHRKLKNLKPELYEKFAIYEYNTIRGIKKMMYFILSFKIWVWIIDDFNWLQFLPKTIRYRLYSGIITASAVYFPPKP